MENFWDDGEMSYRENSPLGEKVQDFILENCEYVLYLRKDKRFHCPAHWDQATLTAKHTTQYCPTCLGLGNLTIPQIIPARISHFDAQVTTRSSDNRYMPGYMENINSVLHVPRAVYPELEDIFLTGEWDKPAQKLGQKPVGKLLRIADIYIIRRTREWFEREVSSFSCGVERIESLRTVLEHQIPQIQNASILEVNPWKRQSFW